MKRKMSLICCLLALTVLSSIAFLACEKKPAGPTYTEPTAAELELVLEMIETDHKKAFSDATPANYELNTIYVLSPAAAYLQYTVAVDTTGGAKEDDVKVVNSAENNKCTVEVNSKSKIEIPYTLTVTLVNKKGEAYKKDDGSLYTVSFSHKIPAYTLVTFEEFVKAADDKSEQTVTVVGYLTGIISTSSGSKGSIYLVDKQGYGYYAYGPTGVITDSITNDEQLRTAWPVGTEIEVSGTATCYNGQYEFNKGCSVTKTGNSVTQEELYVYRNATADWGKAIDNKDKALIPYQNALVELNNAKMVSVSSDNKYYYFTVNGKQFNLYNTNYFMDGEDVKTLLKKFEVGKQATIKGLVSVYSEAYQIYPLGLDAISDVTDATFSNQEKLDATKAEFTFDTKYAEDKEVPLPTTGKAFTDVTIEWALDKDYPGITLNNNVLTVTLQETEQKAKLTATLKIGSDSTTKDFDISVDAVENIEYEPVIINAPAIGDYKIVMDTTAAGGSVLYFDGTLNSKGALNSTDKASKAANVTVAAVEGKEGVYTLNVNGKYLVGYLNGTFNNMKLADEPGEWTWNTELKTFVCTFADKDGKQSTFYFGTYVKENVAGNTFALSKISYVTGENANKVGVSQFVGQFGTMQKKSDIAEPTDEEKLAAIIAKMSTEVTADFDLDAAATWVVKSGSAIVIENGKAKVTRPAAGEENATVVLTATLNEVMQDVTITVKAEESSVTPEPSVKTIAEVKELADGTEVVIKGVVSEIDTAWNTQFNNMSVVLKDETGTILVYRLATLVKVGDTITVTGKVGTYNEKQIAAGATAIIDIAHVCTEWNAATCDKAETCKVCGLVKEGSKALGHIDENNDNICDRCKATMATLSSEKIAVIANTGVLSEDKKSISWTGTNFVVTNNQAKSTSPIRTQDSDHHRVYKSSELVVSSAGEKKISKMVITCTNSEYAKALIGSLGTGVTAKQDGAVVTITLSEAADSITITAGAQFRINSVEVFYAA